MTARAKQSIYQYEGFDGVLEMRNLTELQYGDIFVHYLQLKNP